MSVQRLLTVVAQCVVLSTLVLAAASTSTTFTLPPLPGPYTVGAARLELIDYSRQDPFASTPQPRALMVQFRYPIKDTKSLRPSPYMPANSAQYFEELFSLPNGTIYQLNTRTFLNGRITRPLLSEDGSLPVIIFSPGSGTPEAVYTVFQEALASWGYIVVGVDHTYDSDPVEFPDGHLVHGILTDANNTIATIVRAQDVLFIADQLTILNLVSWIPGLEAVTTTTKCISTTVGIVGHSIGGATAALAMQNSTSPIKAGCSLDGPFYGPILTTGFRGPFFFQSAGTDTINRNGAAAMWPLINGWKDVIEINGTSHDDFTDVAILVPQVPGTGLAKAYQGLLTAKDPARELGVMGAYLKAFLDFAIRGRQEENILSREVPQYPEVTILHFNSSNEPSSFRIV